MNATTLCSPVSGTVGSYSRDDFYQHFNLQNSICCAEFPFEEMKQIFYHAGMDYWPVLTDALSTDEKSKSQKLSA